MKEGDAEDAIDAPTPAGDADDDAAAVGDASNVHAVKSKRHMSKRRRSAMRLVDAKAVESVGLLSRGCGARCIEDAPAPPPPPRAACAAAPPTDDAPDVAGAYVLAPPWVSNMDEPDVADAAVEAMPFCGRTALSIPTGPESKPSSEK